VLAEC